MNPRQTSNERHTTAVALALGLTGAIALAAATIVALAMTVGPVLEPGTGSNENPVAHVRADAE